MAGRVQRTCHQCGSNVGFRISDDGFFYCGYCNSQADDIVDTGVDEELVFNTYSQKSSIRVRPASTNVIPAEPISQVKLTTSQYLDHPDVPVDDEDDGVGPTGPSDFGSTKMNISYEDYYLEIRSRYLTGIQIMIQLQCKALVEEFSVSPLIVGLVGQVWLRFLASTGIMDGQWADQAVHDSEAQMKDEGEEFQPSAQHRGDPVNIHGKRVASVWFKSLRSTIQLPCTLAISFLICHVAREAITSSDMIKWALEGKLPYFAAFNEIEKQIGSSSDACPIQAKRMFRPVKIISSQKLESTAAQIAQKIGLELPSVNFYAIASHFLNQLSLPIPDILPMACRLYEWSKPAELYLSANELRIPTRAYVMSILIVTIRMIFNINGYGMWESIYSNNIENGGGDDEFSSNNLLPSGTKLNGVKLLRILEAKYDELPVLYEYSCDLTSYLQFCKDVVFSDLRPSYEDLEEKTILKEFWDFYQNNKDTGKSDNRKGDTSGPSASANGESKGDEVKKTKSDQSTSNNTSQKTNSCHDGDQYSEHCSQPSKESSTKDEAIRRLKMNMDDKKFCYIPPRVKVKKKDYLHYARRKNDVFVYAVHADYFILLRSCAKVARVETRVMHIAALCLERRLQWLEKSVDSLLHLDLNFSDDCDFCKDESEKNLEDDTMDLNS
ncbi:hypothetical protein CASFOL_010808 [Castilleja foliolosa]|uniref:TATA box-binding protein-associated factor RNA polymerase I subunit B n=1 Tax=Castilleja foliolosa TaxID=1961234 RepID=A0ABD3DTN6_9LAMI